MDELTQYTPLALFTLGGLCGVLRLIPLIFQMDINVPVFSKVIEKLIASDNLDRGLKLCSAAPKALAALGTRGLLTAYQQGTTDSTSLREAYDRGLGGSLAQATGRLAWLSFLGLILIATGAGLGFGLGLYLSTDHLAIGGGALVVVALASFKAAKVKAKAVAGREQIIRFIQDRALTS